MDPVDQKKIIKRLGFLTTQTTNVPKVVITLVEFSVLEMSERKNIIAPPNDEDRCAELYDIVRKKGPKAFKKLVEALRKNGNVHVAKKLLEPVQDSSDESEDESPSSQKSKHKKASGKNDSFDDDQLLNTLAKVCVESNVKSKKSVELDKEDSDNEYSDKEKSDEEDSDNENSDKDSTSEFEWSNSEEEGSSSDSDSEMERATEIFEALFSSSIFESKLKEYRQSNPDDKIYNEDVALELFLDLVLAHQLGELSHEQKKSISIMCIGTVADDIENELRKKCFNIVYVLGLPKLNDPDKIKGVTEIILEYISKGQRCDVQVALEVLYGMICKEDDEMKKIFGRIRVIEVMMTILRNETNSSSNEPWAEPWGIIAQLTDDCEENCMRFLTGGGINVFCDYVKKYDDEQDGEDITGALFVILNMTEQDMVLPALLTENLLTLLINVITTSTESYDSNNFASALALAMLLSLPEINWKHIGLDDHRSSVQKIVRSCFTTWSPKVEPSCGASTFKTFLKLLRMNHTPECQLCAAWVLLNLIYADGARYKKLAKKENIIQCIKQVNGSTKCLKVKKLTEYLIKVLAK